MPRFFVNTVEGDYAVVTGEDARHIAKSLRMKVGEPVILCDGRGTDYHCALTSIREDQVELSVLSSEPSRGEPALEAVLYQAVPKSDKMELIVQKAVELGVSKIVPVLTERCISRPDFKAAQKKRERYQKIALEAAKQCGRGKIPQVEDMLPFSKAVELAVNHGQTILFYERGGAKLADLVSPQTRQISFFVGSEGGFSQEEAQFAEQKGVLLATLGSRILRCETAPLCALSILMHIVGEL